MTANQQLKMYLVVNPLLAPAAVAEAIAHASLGTFLTWKDDPQMLEWIGSSGIKKVVVPTFAEWTALTGQGSVYDPGLHRAGTKHELDAQKTARMFRVTSNGKPRVAVIGIRPGCHMDYPGLGKLPAWGGPRRQKQPKANGKVIRL